MCRAVAGVRSRRLMPAARFEARPRASGGPPFVFFLPTAIYPPCFPNENSYEHQKEQCSDGAGDDGNEYVAFLADSVPDGNEDCCRSDDRDGKRFSIKHIRTSLC